MGTGWTSKLPISIVIAIAFILGAYRIQKDDNGFDGFVLITVAVILVGVWIAAELHDKFFTEYHDTMRRMIREELDRSREEEQNDPS